MGDPDPIEEGRRLGHMRQQAADHLSDKYPRLRPWDRDYENALGGAAEAAFVLRFEPICPLIKLDRVAKPGGDQGREWDIPGLGWIDVKGRPCDSTSADPHLRHPDLLVKVSTGRKAIARLRDYGIETYFVLVWVYKTKCSLMGFETTEGVVKRKPLKGNPKIEPVFWVPCQELIRIRELETAIRSVMLIK